jgi:hypothetical protein
MALHSIAGAVAVVVLCAGCCGNVQTTTWQGTLDYAFPDSAREDAGPSADAGSDAGAAGGATVVGSQATVVALDAYAPWVQNGFSGGYCGSNGFTIDLGPSCQLAATLGSADYGYEGSTGTGSATITGGQPCTLDTPSGAFTVSVQGGSLASSGNTVNILVDTPGANLEFQGNLQ